MSADPNQRPPEIIPGIPPENPLFPEEPQPRIPNENPDPIPQEAPVQEPPEVPLPGKELSFLFSGKKISG